MSQTQLSAPAGHSRLRGAGRVRESAQASHVTPLRVVPAAIRRSGNGAFAVLCMSVLALGLVALLMMNTALASGIYQLKSLQARSGTLTAQQEQLTQVVDDLRSPRTLADKAQQMGMVPAKSMAFIRLPDGAIIGTAQPAKPEQRLNLVTTPVPPPPAPAPAPAPPATTPAPAPAATAAPTTAAPTTAAPTTAAPTKPAPTTPAPTTGTGAPRR